MKRYRAHATVTGGKYLGEVEANSLSEAKEIAFELRSACVCLCHSCASECEDPEITEIIVEEIGNPAR